MLRFVLRLSTPHSFWAKLGKVNERGLQDLVDVLRKIIRYHMPLPIRL